MSAYLDDMPVKVGDVVRCKCALAAPHFTPAKQYKVLEGKKLLDDLGNLVYPSARFT